MVTVRVRVTMVTVRVKVRVTCHRCINYHRGPKRCISAGHNHLIKILLFTCVPVSFLVILEKI